jgi:hypothetical protein
MENATSAAVREQWERLCRSFIEATDTADAALAACNANPDDADAIARLKDAARAEGKALGAIVSAKAAIAATTSDTAILDAWERRAAAFLKVRAMPDDPTTVGETDEQSAQWSIIDVAEAEICTSVATTARGAELQLWTAAVHQFDAAEDEGPCYRADLKYFTEQGDRRDWKDRLLIAAIRSLRAIGGAA